MAQEINPKELGSVLRGLSQTSKGRKVLQQAMIEAGMKPRGGSGSSGLDQAYNQGFSKARETAAAEGKGLYGQFRAGMKGASESRKQFQIATMGTTGSRERVLNMLGIEVGDLFRKNFEKKASEEEVAAAKALFPESDKKSKSSKGEKEASPGNRIEKTRLNLILKNLLEIKGMIRGIESMLTKPNVKPGFTFDPRIGKKGGYRSISGEGKGKIVSASQALSKAPPVKSVTDSKVSRTDALSKAILADEDPMVKLQETVAAIFKSIGEDNKSVHEKLNDLKSQIDDSGGGGLSDILDLIPSRRNKNRPTRRKPTKSTKPKVPSGTGKGMGKVLGGAAKVLGKVAAPLAVGLAAYDGVKGYQNAGEILGLKEGQEATTGQKLSAAAGSVVSGLTFGLVDEKKVAQGIAGVTGAGPAPTPAPAPASGPKFRLGPAAAKRGKIEPSAGKDAAIAAAAKFGITGAHLAQFLAQLDHESAHFTRVEENLRYSAKRLRQIFPKYYKTDAEAQADEMQPEKIANRVYANRMGNGPPSSGDGYRYRGRGLIQLTGKDNYKKFGSMIGIDLVGNPDAAGELNSAAQIAAAFYKKNVIDRGIAAEDTKKVTKAINGGSIGLADRESLFASYMSDPSATQAGGPIGAESNQAPSLAATTDTSVGSPTGSAPAPTSAEMVAQNSGAPVPPPPAGPQPIPNNAGQTMSAASGELATNQMVAAATPAPPTVIPVPTGGGKTNPPPPKQNLPMAQVRSAENSFARAISKDFAHPTAFTSVVVG